MGAPLAGAPFKWGLAEAAEWRQPSMGVSPWNTTASVHANAVSRIVSAQPPMTSRSWHNDPRDLDPRASPRKTQS